MVRHIIHALILLGLGILAWVAYGEWSVEAYRLLFYTLFFVAAIYIIFKVILEKLALRRVKDSKLRHSLRKAISLVAFFLILATVLHVWVEDPQTLLVSYGLIGAGLAIALQDFFKNLLGGIVLFIGGAYRIGDRIEIEGSFGDVIDIGLLYTTLLEIKGWIDGDQVTGRMVVVPNGKALSGLVHNYNKDHSFIWDEISVPITYGSDWRRAREIMRDIATKETRDISESSQKTLSSLGERYYISRRDTEPAVFMRLTDNWILLSVRYVSSVQERRVTQDKLNRLILEVLEKEDAVSIASETLTITNADKS